MEPQPVKETAIPSRPLTGQFIRFSAVGAANTVLDFSVYVGLTRLFAFWDRHIIMAAAVSFGVAAASSFLLNNFWTFGRSASGWRGRGAKFFLIAVGGLWWNTALLYALTRLGSYDLAAKILATGAVLIWNFTLQRKWTFRP